MTKAPRKVADMPIRVTARKDGFRRAGRAHPAAAVEHPAGTFTAAEIAALRAEPMLLVEEVAPADPDEE